jgi:methionyl-tRNA formyltransferase
VAAYGLILPVPILEAPKRGCLNVHASLLPRWRGAAPVQRAILAGDAATGICIMRMEAGLDTGPVLASAETDIGDKTAGVLTGELAEMGAGLIVAVLGDLANYPEVPQPDIGVTYARKVDKAEARLDLAQPATVVERQVRAFAPSPGAFFELAGERFKVLAAEMVERDGDAPGEVLDGRLAIACASGAIRPLVIQRAGRPAMAVDVFLRGFSVPRGTLVG